MEESILYYQNGYNGRLPEQTETMNSYNIVINKIGRQGFLIKWLTGCRKETKVQ